MSGGEGAGRVDELHKRRPHLDLTTTRYPRVLDAMEGEFKKERNETYEVFQLLLRKQRIGESLEQFHFVLSGLAARCAFGTFESRILRDVFFVNMTNREAQNELCRATKTPEEAYRIAYRMKKEIIMQEHSGDDGRHRRIKCTDGWRTSDKSEPVGVTRGGYGNSRGRGRGQP